MSYTKPNQTSFTKLLPNEFVVTLDSGQNVAVAVSVQVEDNSGNPALMATARVVASDGTSEPDANGNSIQSAFTHTSNPTEVTQAGGMAAIQKQMLLAVLGEPVTIWTDPIHATVLENASIRTNIATAAHAGPVADPGSLL